jgi:MYXO-CTERM domain-containing protein
VVIAGLLIAAASGADGAGAWIGLIGGARRVEAGLLAAVMLAGPGLQLADTVWQWRAHRGIALTRTTVPQLPVIASTAAQSEDRTSTLVLWREDGTLTWRLVRGVGLRADDPAAVIAAARLTGPLISADAAEPAPGLNAVSHLVAQVAAGSAEGVADQLAQAGIGFLLVPPDNDGLAWALDSTAGLSRAAETETGICWRVGSASDAARPSWLRVVEADGSQTALSADGGGLPSGAEGRTLVLAETADAGWHASQGGTALEATAVGWQQAFVLRPEGGAVHVEYAPDPWAAVQLGALAVMALVALPVRRRRGEAGES